MSPRRRGKQYWYLGHNWPTLQRGLSAIAELLVICTYEQYQWLVWVELASADLQSCNEISARKYSLLLKDRQTTNRQSLYIFNYLAVRKCDTVHLEWEYFSAIVFPVICEGQQPWIRHQSKNIESLLHWFDSVHYEGDVITDWKTTGKTSGNSTVIIRRQKYELITAFPLRLQYNTNYSALTTNLHENSPNSYSDDCSKRKAQTHSLKQLRGIFV